MSTTEELKSCPFCGGAADITDTMPAGQFWCYCGECTAECSGRDTKAEAIAAWNRRAPEPPASPAEGVAAIKALNDVIAWHEKEIADLEKQIERNDEYNRRSGVFDSTGNDNCRSAIHHHRWSIEAVQRIRSCLVTPPADLAAIVAESEDIEPTRITTGGVTYLAFTSEEYAAIVAERDALKAEVERLQTALRMSDADRRQWFIADTLARQGYFNRADICSAFGVSVPQASMDIRKFVRNFPFVATYNKSAKRYEIRPIDRAALKTGSA